jgi:hypothetical protein
MKNDIVMVISKSALPYILEELLEEVIEHKLLIRVMEDSDFILFCNEGEKISG